MGGTSAADFFLNGQAAMFFSGIWKTPYLRQGKKFKWDVVMFPKGPTGKRGFWLGSACYGLSASSKHKEIGWKLIRFLTGEEAEKTFAATGFAVQYFGGFDTAFLMAAVIAFIGTVAMVLFVKSQPTRVAVP